MSIQKPHILVTNDDGIESPGLWAAVKALSTLGKVWVVAPREQSTSAGRSTPPTSDGYITPHIYRSNGLDVTAYAVGGTPAQAVLLALLDILPQPPDLVVSGINYGTNAGPGITNSGTVGAAIEAAAQKIPALAISIETKMEQELTHSLEVDFSAAAAFTATFAKLLMKHRLPPDVHVIKIEVPSDATPQTPWEITNLSLEPVYLPHLAHRQSCDDPQKIWYTIQPNPSSFQPGTDAHTLFVKRMVAVTPLSIDMTSRVRKSKMERCLRGKT
jgi:5'-nucleotidase